MSITSSTDELQNINILNAVIEHDNLILERARAPEPSSTTSSTGVREVVKAKLKTNLRKLDFTAEEIRIEMEKEEEMWLFCTLFPEQHKFEKDTLINFWMARGLIENDDYKKLIRDSYFDALVAEGCIELTNKCFPSGESMYKVNAEKMKSFTKTGRVKLYHQGNASDPHLTDNIPTNLENLSLVCQDIDQSIFDQFKQLKNLKSLLLFHQTSKASKIIRIPYKVFYNLKHLQVLDLSEICIENLPSTIGEAKELRYLDLSYSLIELLPETIDCLKNLVTLKLKGCVRLYRLPEGIVKLTALRHLDLNVLGQLSFLPKNMGKLTSLETLSAFLIDNGEDRRISQLKNMNNLQGSFCISNLERVSSGMEAKDAALIEKANIKKLELRWSMPRLTESKEQLRDYEVLEQLHPPSSLEDLEISGYSGLKFPDWIGDYKVLHLIVNITLVTCVYTMLLPSLGELPFLRNLHLIDMKRVKSIDAEFRGDVNIAFPALERLTIVGMSRLETWTDVKEVDFPRLCKLVIEHCPKLIALPSLSYFHSLKQLEISQCPKLSSWSKTSFPSSLKMLIVENCPSFKRRFRKPNNKDQMKIMHVHNVWIDHEETANLNAATQVL